MCRVSAERLPLVATAPVPTINFALPSLAWAALRRRAMWAAAAINSSDSSAMCRAQRSRRLCDVDTALLEREAADLAKRGEKVATCRDIRKVLDDKSIDAVIMATPNHWHALDTIWACQAGKDVYVEKPLAQHLRRPADGRRGAESTAASSSTARRAAPSTALRQAFHFLHAGEIGPIRFGPWPPCTAGKGSARPPAPRRFPPRVDYDSWCGPVAKAAAPRPALALRLALVLEHRHGEMATTAYTSWTSAAGHWAERLPRRAMSLGGRFVFNDAGQTPNTQLALAWISVPVPMIYEIHNLPEAA